jgi:UDP-N-acetylglucosamine 2-epimerase (non-hydrolysing)/GDP/UDP-N,N'-diacetylbacillosamine 2-epimerase (hydrolysing)
MNKRKLCVVTGSRADYGLLYWLMRRIADDPDLCLQTLVTGMHLSPEFGMTFREIEKDGFTINAKVDMLLSSDTPVGIAKSMGLGVIGSIDALERLRPDILVLLGDRFEIFSVVQAALIAMIPVAHIAGGDTTEGAFDEALRHSITKMSHLHFVTNDVAARRVRQLGENPNYIFNVGSPGIDGIKRLKPIAREELERLLQFRFRPRNLLITFHPETLGSQTAQEQFRELLLALDRVAPDIGLIFTKPNADTEGRRLIDMIDRHVEARPQATAFVSMGQRVYLSTVMQADAVVGNSSSGLYEVPSFRKPTVDIGDRQKGRPRASSIIHCEPKADDIARAIREAMVKDCVDAINPYGDGESSERIVQALKGIAEPKSLLKKHFYDTTP